MGIDDTSDDSSGVRLTWEQKYNIFNEYKQRGVNGGEELLLCEESEWAKVELGLSDLLFYRIILQNGRKSSSDFPICHRMK